MSPKLATAGFHGVWIAKGGQSKKSYGVNCGSPVMCSVMEEWKGFGPFGISVVRECVQYNPRYDVVKGGRCVLGTKKKHVGMTQRSGLW